MKKRSIPDAAKADWSNTGSFMNKPKHGWCHTDGEIARGVTYQALVICIQFLKIAKTHLQNKVYEIIIDLQNVEILSTI